MTNIDLSIIEQDDNDADPFWDGVGGKNKLQMSLVQIDMM